MPDAHARLAPSAAERWIACPASIRMSEKALAMKAAPAESPYAAEGTTAHVLAEIEASYAFGLTTAREHQARAAQWLADHPELDEDTVLEMRQHIAGYVALLKDRQLAYPDTFVRLEQRMPCGVPNSWGTSDAVLVSPRHVEIVDLKYGSGVSVSAVDNPQLRLYGCGALDTYGDVLGDTELVRVTVYQPRMYPSISSEDMTADELRDWRADIVIPAARRALNDPDAPFGPSEKVCRWCDAAGICKVRTEYMVEQDFGEDVDVLSMTETAEWLKRVPEIRDWCNAIEAAALRRAYAGKETLPGYKVVRGNANRKITDEDAALDLLVGAGFKRDQVMRESFQTLGHLEKLVGKKRLPELLGELLNKPEGKPALAPDDDSRPAIDPTSEAVKDFT